MQDKTKREVNVIEEKNLTENCEYKVLKNLQLLFYFIKFSIGMNLKINPMKFYKLYG